MTNNTPSAPWQPITRPRCEVTKSLRLLCQARLKHQSVLVIYSQRTHCGGPSNDFGITIERAYLPPWFIKGGRGDQLLFIIYPSIPQCRRGGQSLTACQPKRTEHSGISQFILLYLRGKGGFTGVSSPLQTFNPLGPRHAFCLTPIHKYLELSSGGMREERPNPRDDHSSPFPNTYRTGRHPHPPLGVRAYGKVAFKVTGSLFTACIFWGGKGNFKPGVGKNQHCWNPIRRVTARGIWFSRMSF